MPFQFRRYFSIKNTSDVEQWITSLESIVHLQTCISFLPSVIIKTLVRRGQTFMAIQCKIKKWNRSVDLHIYFFGKLSLVRTLQFLTTTRSPNRVSFSISRICCLVKGVPCPRGYVWGCGEIYKPTIWRYLSELFEAARAGNLARQFAVWPFLCIARNGDPTRHSCGCLCWC